MFRNKAFLILLAVMTFVLTACQAGGTQAQDNGLISESLILPEEVNYNTAQVTVADYEKTVGGNAAVVYPYGATLSPDFSGAKLKEILVSSGASVQKGEAVAIFELPSRSTELAELQLQLQRAQESLETGKLDRLEAIAEKEEDNARLQGYKLKIAEVELEKLRIAYEQFVYGQQRTINNIAKSITELEEEASDNVLTAPFDGVVTNVAALFPGDQVAAGRTIVTMQASDYYWVGISDHPDELIYNREVVIEYGSKNDRKTMTGKIVAAPGILPDDVSISYALVEVDETVDPSTIQKGVEYSFVTEEVPSALVVDRKAIEKEDGKSYVYLLEDGVVKKRYVQVGSSNTEVAWILDGLSEGQSVMVD